MKQKTLFLVVASMLAVAIGSAWGAGTNLPYGDDFEGGTNGNDLPEPWSFTDVGRYDSSQETIDGSDNVAYFTDEGTFSIYGGAGPYSNVWWKCYAKITASSGDPSSVDNGTAALFYIKTDGTLRAYSGGAWTEVTNGLSTSGWIGLAVHLDYVNKKWDIYKTPENYNFGDSAQKLNSSMLSFNENTTSTEFTEAVIEGTTYIDRFAVNVDSVAVTDGSLTNVADAAVGIVLGENLTGVLTKYFSDTDSYINGPLGEALASALLDTDLIYVYLPGSAGGPWQTYLCHGPGQPFTQPGGGGTAGLGVQITPTTAIFLDYNGVGTRNPAHVTAYDLPQDATDNIVIYGTNVANGAGWNAFAMPFGAVNNGAITDGAMQDMGTFTGMAQGDQIWIKKVNGGYELPIIYGTSWKQSGRNANVTIVPGQSFWYFRNATGNGEWDAASITVE